MNNKILKMIINNKLIIVECVIEKLGISCRVQTAAGFQLDITNNAGESAVTVKTVDTKKVIVSTEDIKTVEIVLWTVGVVR